MTCVTFVMKNVTVPSKWGNSAWFKLLVFWFTCAFLTMAQRIQKKRCRSTHIVPRYRYKVQEKNCTESYPIHGPVIGCCERGSRTTTSLYILVFKMAWSEISRIAHCSLHPCLPLNIHLFLHCGALHIANLHCFIVGFGRVTEYFAGKL